MKTPKAKKVKKVSLPVETIEQPVDNPPQVEPEYVITVTIEQSTYVGYGTTALDALQAIPTPETISSGSLLITKGNKSKEMFYPTMQLKRLFNPYNQEFLIHDLESGMA